MNDDGFIRRRRIGHFFLRLLFGNHAAATVDPKFRCLDFQIEERSVDWLGQHIVHSRSGRLCIGIIAPRACG